jgi:citrate lyase subunit beta-like protein
MRARRALLYVPGDDLHKIQKASTLDVDSICLDLEDGVALNRKSAARQTIKRAINSIDFDRSECLVRVNPVGSPFFEQDLLEILPLRPDGIVIPKVNHPDHIKIVSDRISIVEAAQGRSAGSTILIAIIESAMAVLNLASIVSSDSRLQALIFGAEDFAVDIGARRSEAGWEVFYARSALITYCAAHDLQAIDMVEIDFQDLERLAAQSRQGASLGFTGKQVIHPNQVKVVQEAFTPSDQEILDAETLIAQFDQHQSQGRGAFALDGRMVDAPLIKSAQSVLQRARAAGKLN